jgi:hypothetical protein
VLANSLIIPIEKPYTQVDKITMVASPQQFTKDELKIMIDALVFTLSCLSRDQIYNNGNIGSVLTKAEGLLKQV